jgi:hypothetical protein
MENTAAQSLYDLLVTRDFEPEILSSAGKPVTNPAEAEVFSFDWKIQGQNYGTVVVLLGADNELEVYYGDNLGRGMDPEHKSEWYDFLSQLKNFATRNLLTFELNNINRLKYTMQGMAAIKEGLFEGYYGRKNISYSDQPQQTRIMIRHNRDLQEGEPRYRAIESLFVENAAGERFRVPSRSLIHGRMLARHIAEGGTPYDAFGNYINQLVQEIATLSRFVRASRDRRLSPAAEILANEARHHYHNLRAKARRMVGQRGYREVRDNFDPAETVAGESAVATIREMFLEPHIDQRIEEALPVLARLSAAVIPDQPTVKEDTMREIQEFEDWAHSITEGTWALPDTPRAQQQLQKLLSQPLEVGADAVNATEQLSDIFGDDELFDRLADLAERDAEADARDIIRGRLSELGIDIQETATEPDQAPINQRPKPVQSTPDMAENLDTDGVMMTRPSNMSSESVDKELSRLRKLCS